MKKRVRRSGFTLPEVLVTVTVVAVLAAVVVPAVTQYVGKGDIPATQSDLREIRTAITAYASDTRSYPSNFYELENQPAGLTTWKGPYTGAAFGSSGTASSATAFFTSGGANIKLGPAISNASGYLTSTLAFNVASTTCQQLWDLDKALDSGAGTQAGATTAAGVGMLVWTGGCLVANPGTALASAATITLRLMAVGQ